MRTKALLLTAALGVAGAATSMAQVYSVNSVGYINLTCPQGFTLVADQFSPTPGGDRQIKTLLAGVPDGTAVYKFNGNGFDISTYDPFGAGGPDGWDPDGTATIDHGGGVYIFNPAATAITVTFVGEVATGPLSTPVAKGFSVLSSKVPQAGKVSTDLLFPKRDGDAVYKSVGGAYDIYTYDPFGAGGPDGWDPQEPTIGVGEAFFMFNPLAAPADPAHDNWDRVFTL